jgi:MFS family permease
VTQTVATRRSGLGGDFHRFWLAAAASNLGDGIRLGALPLLALRLTSDPVLVGATTAATIAPWVLAPLAGVLVDRADRRRLMVAGQLGRAVLVLVLVGLLAADALSIWVLLAIAAGLGCGEVVVDTASQAAIPQLVAPEQLDRANARLEMATQLLNEVAGVAVGALLFAWLTSLPFAVDAVTFLVGAALLTSVRRPLQGDRRARASVRADLAEGVTFLARHGFLRNLMFGAAVSNIATNMSFAVLVVLVIDRLGEAESTYGLVVAVSATGGVVGSLAAGWLTARLGRQVVLVAAPLAMAAALAVTAAVDDLVVIAAAWFVIKLALISLIVPAISLRQAITPDHLLGRVVATFRMVGIGAAPVGALLGGVLTQLTDIRTTNAVAAAIMLASVALLAGALRHLPKNDATPAGSGRQGSGQESTR